MQNISVQNFKNQNPSFGAKITPAYKIAEKVVKEVTSNEYQSSTYLDFVRYTQKKFINQYHRGLVLLKLAELKTKLDFYRMLICHRFANRNLEDFQKAFKELLSLTKLTNCGENAFLVHGELTRLGIPSRVVSDRNIDHSFVIVNREKPFNSYRDKEKGNIVADAWLRRVYPNIDEAYTDFKLKFDAKMDLDCNGKKTSPLVDVTDAPYKCLIKPNMSIADEVQNNAVIAQIKQIGESIRKIVGYEANILKKTTSHIENISDNNRIIGSYASDMTENIRRTLARMGT